MLSENLRYALPDNLGQEDNCQVYRFEFTVASLPYFTHPIIASLDHPLFRRRERG
jgi:hypothetical protein